MSLNNAPVRAVLFDLDGTLLDTVGELARAANRMLAKLGLAERGESEIRDFIGQGTPRLVERCLGVHTDRLDEALTIFNAVYVEESGQGTKIFPGVIEGIEYPAHPFCLGVQWHPEYFVTPADEKIMKAFVEACNP